MFRGVSRAGLRQIRRTANRPIAGSGVLHNGQQQQNQHQHRNYHGDRNTEDQERKSEFGLYAGSLVASLVGAGCFYYFKTTNIAHTKSAQTINPIAPSPTSSSPATSTPPEDDRPTALPDLPTYRMLEVNQHNGSTSSASASSASSVWVTYGAGVYDITAFVPQHPGNVTNIMMAAGTAIDPFWQTFQQHNTRAVRTLLESFRIGNLHPEDVCSRAELHDPWAAEPLRHAALKPASKRPFNAEPPAAMLIRDFVTPSDLFYVRNHLPVPLIAEADYELAVEVEGGDGGEELAEQVVRTLTLAELRRMPKHSVTVTIMCGGNRRSEMHAVRPVRGLHWGKAAVGTAVWSGPRLRDVLAEMGVSSDDERHVHFEGLDIDATAAPYAASIPLHKAMDPRGDVILAYEMNGAPLTRDHGYPVRVIVPGVVGARHVKWLGRIVVAPAECSSHWQQGDYKGFSPSTGWDTVDFSKAVSMQNMPVTSAICNMETGDEVVASQEGRIEVRGYAWSGGGSRILRVDLTADQGRTWHVAELQHAEGEGEGRLPTGRNWAWTLWRAWIPVPERGVEEEQGAQPVEVWSKAVDANYNVQPETFENTWNLRGVLSHAYCRVKVAVRRPKVEATADAK